MITTANRNDLCDATLSPVIQLQNLILNQDGITQLFKKILMCFHVAGLRLSIHFFLAVLLGSLLLPPVIANQHQRH